MSSSPGAADKDEIGRGKKTETLALVTLTHSPETSLLPCFEGQTHRERIVGSAEMDSFAAYGSDSSQDDGIATESAAVPSFKPAWQTADEDDSEDESKEDAQGQKAEAPAAKEDHKPVPARADEPAVKRKKLPSALDALNTATPTFLASAPEPEPDEVRPPPPTPC